MGEGNIMKAFRLVLSQESGFGLLLRFKSIVKHKLLWAMPSRAQNTIFNLLLLILLLRVFLTSDDLHKSTDHNFSNLCFMVKILQEPFFFFLVVMWHFFAMILASIRRFCRIPSHLDLWNLTYQNSGCVMAGEQCQCYTSTSADWLQEGVFLWGQTPVTSNHFLLVTFKIQGAN